MKEMQGPTAPDLPGSIEKIEKLLAEARDPEKLRVGMGIRLALGMAQELGAGLPLGSGTANLVRAWRDEHGEEAVDAAVAVARQFLTKPEEMRKALGERLGLG